VTEPMNLQIDVGDDKSTAEKWLYRSAIADWISIDALIQRGIFYPLPSGSATNPC